MTQILLALLALTTIQDHGPQSLTVTVTDPYAVLGPDWRVHASLFRNSGGQAHGTRYLSTTGIARFDSVPPGVGTLELQWLRSEQDPVEEYNWVTLWKQPLQILAGESAAAAWDLNTMLAMVEISLNDPPEGLLPEQISVFIRHSDPEAGPGIDFQTFRSFDPRRVPASLGTEFEVWADTLNWRFGSTFLGDFTVTAPGLQRLKLFFPSGRIEVRVLGPPPQQDPDWSHYLLSLQADLSTTEQRAPVSLRVGQDGRGSFTLVRPGDYDLILARSDDDDAETAEGQVTRHIHFDGGTLQVDFAVSGSGSAAIVMPPAPPAGAAPPAASKPELSLYRNAKLISTWPMASTHGAKRLVEDLGPGGWVAVATWGTWASSLDFEVVPGAVAQVMLPEWTPRIPVHLQVECAEGRGLRQLQILDPRGLYHVAREGPGESDWLTYLSAGTAGLVDQPVSGPRRVFPFEVPAALPVGQEIFEVVIRLGPE